MSRKLFLAIAFLSFAFLIGAGAALAQAGRPSAIQDTRALTFDHFFLFFSDSQDSPWQESSTVVDASGGVHTIFYTTQSVYYAYCSANCGDPDNWLELPIFATDTLAEPTLGVDANGRPRLMWYAEYDGNMHYYYAECNANCVNNAVNWSSVAIADLSSYDYPHNIGYAALDAQGRPRLVYEMSNYPDYGFNYLSCDAGCITASNWQTTAVVTSGYRPDMNLQVAFDQNGRPRVVGYDDNSNALVYAECDGSCSTAANWDSVALFDVGYNFYYYSFALRLNAQGHPRIAYYQKDSSDNVLLSYAWSDADSLTAAGWSSYTLSYPTNDELSLDLALDSQGRPAIVYSTDTFDLGYVTCTANCETNNPTWQQQSIETGDELDDSYPIAPIPDCTPGSWMVIGYPSLALDAADNLHVSYLVGHGQICKDSQGHYITYFDTKGIRFARAGDSSGPTPTPSVTPATPLPPGNFRVYLPSIIR